MKIQLILALMVTFLGISCSDDDPNPVNPTTETYMTLTAGSSRSYEVKNNTPPATTNTYTVTSINKDSIINGRTYRVFTSSTGGSEYYAKSGNDYYTYQILPVAMGTKNVEILFLKDNAAVGTTWLAASSPLTIPGFPTLTININNKIEEKGLSKTVNGKAYTDVIHVSSVISVANVPGGGVTSDIHYFYAPKYGLIENSVILSSTLAPIAVDTDTRLMGANF